MISEIKHVLVCNFILITHMYRTIGRGIGRVDACLSTGASVQTHNLYMMSLDLQFKACIIRGS